MKITKITAKTVTINGEPGDRIGLDNDGFCYDSITLSFSGDEKMRETLIDLININKDEMSFQDWQDFHDNRAYTIAKAIKTLPIYRSKKVFVGHSF